MDCSLPWLEDKVIMCLLVCVNQAELVDGLVGCRMHLAVSWVEEEEAERLLVRSETENH